ncbi:MAG: dicarboxylate/amino acid:cation symporter [Gammaproteobacteria bacterium]|nr:dicarboxylate/amino acid:cation symporter [Gammaproteobacteria bacterium]
MDNRLLFPAVVAAALLGWLVAMVFGDVTWLNETAELLKSIFLSALRAIVAPLIFFSLVSGILRLGDTAELGRIGGTTLLYYLSTTSIAITLGLISVFLVHPWTYTEAVTNLPTSGTELSLLGDESAGVAGLLAGVVKSTLINPISALAQTNILAIVVNALVIGLALLLITEKESSVRRGIATITDALFKITGWIIWTVPIGVLGIVYQLSVVTDMSLIVQLLSFSLLVVVVTLIHAIVVLPSFAYFLGNMHPATFFKHAARPLVVAFTTASSAATVPVTLQAAENLGIRKSTFSFVVPFGATANMDGSALFEGIAAVFVAYLFGIELGAIEIVVIFFAAMAASIGAPGIPSGSMVGMQMVLIAVGLPLEAIGILLIVERPLDMIRTACNVEGDLAGCTVIDRFSHAALDDTAVDVSEATAETVSA